MKCSICNNEIVLVLPYTEDPDYVEGNSRWECPEMHVAMDIHDNVVTHYRLYFQRGNTLYQISGNRPSGYTELLHKVVGNRYFRKGYKLMMKIPKFVEPIIANDIVKTEFMFDKLKKLMVFS